MLRKAIVVFALFAYTGFSYAEVAIVQRGDGATVKITTTRIANSDNQAPSYEGNRQDETEYYSDSNRHGNVIYVFPNVDYAPHAGHGSQIDYAPQNGHAPNTVHTPNIDYAPNRSGAAPNIGAGFDNSGH